MPFESQWVVFCPRQSCNILKPIQELNENMALLNYKKRLGSAILIERKFHSIRLLWDYSLRTKPSLFIISNARQTIFNKVKLRCKSIKTVFGCYTKKSCGSCRTITSCQKRDLNERFEFIKIFKDHSCFLWIFNTNCLFQW